MRAIDKFERYGKKHYNSQDVLKNHILKTFPVVKVQDPTDESVATQYADKSTHIWLIQEDLDILRTFPIHFKPADSKKDFVHVFPYVYKHSLRIKSWDMCKLVPTQNSNGEQIKQDHICAVYDFYQGHGKFDLFYIGDETNILYANLKTRFPHAQCVDSIDTAQALSETDMLWIVPEDIEVTDIFKFSYRPDDWSHDYVHMFRNGSSKDGIILIPKTYELTEKELKHRFFVGKKEVGILASNPLPYPIYNFKDYNEYKDALDNCKSEMFWWLPNDVEADDDFDFKLYFDHHNQYDRQLNHVFLNGENYDGVVLFSKNSPVTEKEFAHRFYSKKKEHEVVASRPKKFDDFVVDTYEDYVDACKRSSTEMFWMIPSDVEAKSHFQFDTYFSHHNQYDRNISHVFLNGDTYDGISLVSVNSNLTKKEIENRFFAKKKEWNTSASVPLPYQVFEIDSYEDYLYALENTTQDLFWMSSKNIKILDYDILENFYISYHSVVDRNQHHSFLHAVDGETYRTGLYLLNKNKKLTRKEIEHRFIAQRKEWNIVLSGPIQYDIFSVETYNDYLFALENTKTEMFYVTSPNISVDFAFNHYFEYSNTYDRTINHVFGHKANNNILFNGLWLMSVHSPVTEKEINHKHLVNRKEWDIVASSAVVYDEFIVETYDDYLYALENTNTEMFWGTTNNVDFYSGMVKDTYFSHDNTYDRQINHSFIHKVNSEEFYNGVFLFSKHAPVTEKEIEHRHIVNVKQWDIVASGPLTYDKFIIETYEDYREALEKSKTELFWADTHNIDTSKFDFSSIYFTHDNEYDRENNHAFAHGVSGNILYNGLFLLSKHAPITAKELEYRHIVNVKEWLTIASKPITYPIHVVDSFEDFEIAFYNSGPEMFWMSSANIDTSEFDFSSVYFDHSNEYDRTINHAFKHVVDGKEYYNGLFLISRHSPISRKEVEHRFIADRKEWDIIASGPKKYELFTVDKWQDYEFAMNNCETEMFWMTSANIDTSDFDFDIYFVHDNEYDRSTNHAFVHRTKDKDTYNGLFLMSANKAVTPKEIEFKHLAECKYWDIVGSKPKQYDKFVVESYDDYLEALENSETEMFWATSNNVNDSDFDYSIYFTHDNTYDRNINHAFLHCGNKYNGVFLLSKNKPLTSKEIEYRHIIDAKEWTVPSTSAKNYEVFTIDTYDDYVEAFSNTKTEMFWGVSKQTVLLHPLDIYFTHDNEFDRTSNHHFLNKGPEGLDYNGVILYSKHSPATEKEVEHKHVAKRKEWDIIVSKQGQYDKFYVETYNDYLYALENSKTELFWMNSHNIDTSDFRFDIKFAWANEYDRKINHAFIHEVDGMQMYNGLYLMSTHAPVTEKEIEHRHIVNAKQWDIVATGPVEYDKYEIETYSDYLEAMETCETEMFWGYTNNMDVRHFDFDIYFSHDNEYDRKQNHSFIHKVGNQKLRNGVFLYSKHRPVTQREIEYRHLLAGKEWDMVASTPVKYDIFVVDNYIDYLAAIDNSKTELFWAVPSDVEVDIGFEFDMYFTHGNKYDRGTNHMFLNGEHYDGVVLFSKHSLITQKELEHRFYTKSKKHEVVISQPKPYDSFVIETYDDYIKALDTSKSEMFWALNNNIKIEKSFDFNMYFSHHNTYDRGMNHTFVHRANDEDHHNGVFLLSKQSPLTQKEIEHRLIVKRKEWNIVASVPVQYEKFVVNSYADYEYARNKSKTEMFWIIPPEVEVAEDFIFDMYFTHNQWFERSTNHVFKNGNAWDGISLASKQSMITEREIVMRFLANKKQHDIVASNPKPYDIVFISKDEEHADSNYTDLLQRFPNTKRVHGVEGIHAAHIEAAKLCTTDMIWIVDADAEIVKNFNFDYYVPAYDPDGRKTVHVWKSQNPINGLIYGYGAVKLLPRDLTLNMDTNKPDMTTSISPLFKTVNRVSNITKFNTDEFSTWRSAFRECVKLSARAIDGQLDEETEFRLNAWCTRGKDKQFGEICIAGAKAGKQYGEDNRSNLAALRKINDFDWLSDQFNNLKNSF